MSYLRALDTLWKRLSEPAPGRVQVVTGPRQVGKTTLLLDLARRWPGQAVYGAADAPEAALPGWFELQWERAAQRAESQPGLLLLDEIQYLPDWSRRLKAEVDRIRQHAIRMHVVVSGSAALRLGAGGRESMAGRFERIVLGHWGARDLAGAFQLSADDATRTVVQWGTFPGSMALRSDFARWRAYLRDAIIDPAVGRDLLALERVRKPALLRQAFAICAGHPAEIMSLSKMAGSLAEGSLTTLAHYLDLLAEAYLVAALPKQAGSEVRRRAAPPKLVPLNNAFVSAALEVLPERETDPQRWGRLVENACLAHLFNAGQTVRYWREEPLEVDAVVESSWGQWALEIKTSDVVSQDLAGLLEFTRRHPAYRPLVVCDEADVMRIQRRGVDARSWASLLWDGLGPEPTEGGHWPAG